MSADAPAAALAREARLPGELRCRTAERSRQPPDKIEIPTQIASLHETQSRADCFVRGGKAMERDRRIKMVLGVERHVPHQEPHRGVGQGRSGIG